MSSKQKSSKQKSSKQKSNDKCLCGSGKKYKKCCKNELISIRNKMEEYSNKADELYKICINDGCDNLCNPTIWIFNQDKLRDSWEKYIKSTENLPEFIKNSMLNNSYSNYMSFMYNTYPIGFGNKLKECYNNKIDCDGAEIFYKLKNLKMNSG